MRYFLYLLLMTGCSAVFGQARFNVLDYGAVADTTVLSTQAIQAAIDACASQGGGTVQVPAGNYLSGTLSLKSNIHLQLDAGATIYASRNPEDFGQEARAIGATDKALAEMLIGAINAHNISIGGRGTLHGRAVRETYLREEASAVPADSVTGREVANAVRYGADYRSKFRRVAPSPGLVNFTNCTNVSIRDIQVIESAFWSVHLQNCERVNVDGIYITSNRHNGVNADGLDIDGCRYVTVSNCRIDTGDDALCLKTTQKDAEASCRNITVTNCILTSSSAALKIGTESHADFEDITVSNCVIAGANRGLNMIIRDGGCVRNVLFSNLIIRTERKETFWWGNGDPVWFTIQQRNGHPTGGNIENIVIDNVIAHGQSGIRMEGFSNRLKNIRLSRIQLYMEPEAAVDKRARNAFLFDGVDGLRLTDCSVHWNTEQPEPAWESAYFFRRINGLKLEQVEGGKAPGSAYEAFRYEECFFNEE